VRLGYSESKMLIAPETPMDSFSLPATKWRPLEGAQTQGHGCRRASTSLVAPLLQRMFFGLYVLARSGNDSAQAQEHATEHDARYDQDKSDKEEAHGLWKVR
jgi:hypothetical protein